jgi:hypothetical protein
MGVLPSKHNSALPAPVSEDILRVFEADGAPGPADFPPRLDWRSPFSSKWNKEALYLLALGFQQEIKANKHPQIKGDADHLTTKDFVSLCTTKLARTRRDYLNTLPPENGDPQEKVRNVADKKSLTMMKARRFSRREGVRWSHVLSEQTNSSNTDVRTPQENY